MHRTTLRHSPFLRFVIEPVEGGGSSTDGESEKPSGEQGSSEEGAKPSEDDTLGEKGLKALKAERDARAKAEADLAALRKEIADSKLTAEQKAAADLAEAQKTAQENAAKALRYEVAASKGLDLSLAPRLVGATKADLEADADALKESIGKAGTGTPRPDPSAGGGAGGADKTASVGAGRDLYAERHKSKNTQK